MPFNPIDDDDQASLLIEREVGMALRLSLEAATREPLSGQMALLLLRLALAEALQAAVENDSVERESDQVRQSVAVLGTEAVL